MFFCEKSLQFQNYAHNHALFFFLIKARTTTITTIFVKKYDIVYVQIKKQQLTKTKNKTNELKTQKQEEEYQKLSLKTAGKGAKEQPDSSIAQI